MMAAQGLTPLMPRDLATAQFILTFDANHQVARVASESLARMHPRIANAVLSDREMPPAALGYLTRVLATHDEYAKVLLLNPATPTDAFIDAASVRSEQLCETIAAHQARIERVADFLGRDGIILDGLRVFEDALLRLSDEERIHVALRIPRGHDIPEC